MAQQSGYLLLADISGYTSFVTQTELEHAEEILASLIHAVVEQTRLPLKVLELEGDAIFSYAPARSFSDGQTLVDMIERMYVAFAQARANIHHNTTCTCTACQLAPSLDLKFVAHFGTFTFRQIGAHTGMTGQDVILVHRLLKNSIIETKGTPSYTFFSEACLEAIGLPDLAETMQHHTETYSHLGTVGGYVYDMHAFWTAYQAQRQVFIEEEEAWVVEEVDLPAPPVLAWEFITQGAYRQQWLQADAIQVFNQQHGRSGTGLIEHCSHGKSQAVNEIVDWQPFDYLTHRSQLPLKGFFYLTSYLTPHDGGTRMSMRMSRPESTHALLTFLLRVLVNVIRLPNAFRASGTRLAALVEREMDQRTYRLGQAAADQPVPV